MVSQNLTAITKELLLWCLERDITLIAKHLPGVWNKIANEESRVMKDRTDWKLNPEVFIQLNRQLGPLTVDLFVSCPTNQLPWYFCWRPDPEAEAFSQWWDNLGGRAMPTHHRGRTLSHVRTQRATLVLVAAVWKTQAWHPTLLGMLMDFLIMLHHQDGLIQPLAAWPISGNNTDTDF